MRADVLKIISEQSDSFINQIRRNIQASGEYATGKSSDSIYSLISEQDGVFTLEINAKPFFSVLETGRKPTPDKKPSKAMIENITEWCDAKGLNSNLAWAIATDINKKGTKLWQQGGRTDIYTDEKQSFVEELLNAIAKQIGDEVFSNLKSSFQ